jgi:hypothetical protein
MLEEEKQGVPPQEKEAIKSLSLPSTEIADGVVYYIVNVTGSFSKWSIRKRYSQFEELCNQANDMARHLPPGCVLPPKMPKLFFSHVSKEFIEERRCLLESFLKKLNKVKEVMEAPLWMHFLTTDRKGQLQDDVPDAEAGLPDDVEITGITIPATRQMSDPVLFQIDVQNVRKRKTFSKWTVLKRFGQFFEMDTAVRQSFAENPEILATLPAPPARKAKLLHDHMDTEFIEQRRVLLENYLNSMLRNLHVVRNSTFLMFLGVSV